MLHQYNDPDEVFEILKYFGRDPNELGASQIRRAAVKKSLHIIAKRALYFSPLSDKGEDRALFAVWEREFSDLLEPPPHQQYICPRVELLETDLRNEFVKLFHAITAATPMVSFVDPAQSFLVIMTSRLITSCFAGFLDGLVHHKFDLDRTSRWQEAPSMHREILHDLGNRETSRASSESELSLLTCRCSYCLNDTVVLALENSPPE